MNNGQSKKVIVITGATQGLGYALAEWFCGHFKDKAIVYLTGRTAASALQAVERLKQQDLHPEPAELNVADRQSIDRFMQELHHKKLGIDVLISNAAARITPDKSNAAQVDTFVQTNNLGTTNMLRACKPLLRDNARVLVVASAFGSLRNLPSQLHDQFDERTMNLDDIDATMLNYATLVRTGRDKTQGWPEWINPPSKIGQVAAMKIFYRLHLEEFKKRGIRVNAVCPGLMDTGASRPWFKDMSSAQTPQQAVVDVAWLATLPGNADVPQAELIQHRQVIPWR